METNLIPNSPAKSFDPKWDKFESTFYWKLHMDAKNPINRTALMMGYSKKEFQREAQDKQQMLKSKILNLFQHGYFNRFLKWEISQRVGTYIDLRRDPIILILFPGSFEMPEPNREVIWKQYGSFLTEFYNRKEEGKAMEGIIRDKKRPANADDFLNASLQADKLPTIQHLYSYMLRLSKHGHPEGAINQFYLKVKDIKKW